MSLARFSKSFAFTERVEDRGERQGERNERRDEVRNQYHENNPGSFWEENPGWSAWAITRPFAWADWDSVGSWCGYSGEPTSHSYGEDIYYTGDQVYAGDQPIATVIATQAPSAEPAKGDWLPLGVFAVTSWVAACRCEERGGGGRGRN